MGIRKPKLRRPSEYQIDCQWYEQYSPAVMYGAKIDPNSIESPDDILGSPVAIEDGGVPVGIAQIINFDGFTVTDTSTPDFPEITISSGLVSTPVEEYFTGFTGVNITLSQAPLDEFRLFKNGQLLTVGGSDYSRTATAVTLTIPAQTNDFYTALYNVNAATTGYVEDFQTGITGSVVTLPSIPNTELRVFRNGILQVGSGNDYSIAGAVLTFTNALIASDEITSLYIQ